MRKITVLLCAFLVLTSFDKRELDQEFDIVGEWEGVDESGESGGFSFDSEGYVIMTKGGIKMGGKNFDNNGKKLSLTYRFDSKPKPAHLDIIVKEEGGESRTMLLLIKIVDKNTMVMAQEGPGARPKSFTQDNSMTFKRTQ